MQVGVGVARVHGNVWSSDSSEYKSAYGLNMSRKAFKQATKSVQCDGNGIGSLSEPGIRDPA